MPDYTYTHGSSNPLNRLRFLVGDHRGVSGSASGWAFSDQELCDVLTITGSGVLHSARVVLQCRINREAMSAGVAGTTDTTDRPQQLIHAQRSMEHLDYPSSEKALPIVQGRTDAELPDYDLEDGTS